jgi:thioredoxin
MKTRIATLLIIALYFIGCQSQTSKTIQTIDVKAYKEKLKTTDNPQLLDVRTPEEFSVERIESAVNVNWNGDDFETKAASYDKTKPIFVYCKVGGRSAQAASKLAELGFKEIYNLEGGIMKWNISKNSKPSDKIIGMCNQEYGELIKSDKKVMVNFFAEWCAPCKKMAPFITKMQTDYKDKVVIVRLDADKNKTIVEELKLDGLPVIIIYENGKEIWRNVGFLSEEDLKKQL